MRLSDVLMTLYLVEIISKPSKAEEMSFSYYVLYSFLSLPMKEKSICNWLENFSHDLVIKKVFFLRAEVVGWRDHMKTFGQTNQIDL